MMGKKEARREGISFLNKRATFSYALLDTYVAGLQLLGTEIKSIRGGKVNLTDAYGYFDDRGELWAKGIHISPYGLGGREDYNPIRRRKLLLTKGELKRLRKKQEQKGYTIAVVRLFVNEKGLAKLAIALAKGKKLYDKRESIKARDLKRKMRREIG